MAPESSETVEREECEAQGQVAPRFGQRLQRFNSLPRLRSGRQRVALALTVPLLVVLGLGTAAVARAGGDTDEVLAMLDFTHVEGRFRLCDGQDGTYDE